MFIASSPHTTPRAKARLQRRYAAERRFRFYGFCAILIALTGLFILLGSIFRNGIAGFFHYEIALPIHFTTGVIDPAGDHSEASLRTGDYAPLLRQAMRTLFPEVEGRSNLRALYGLVSAGGEDRLRQMVLANPELLNTTLEVTIPVSDEADMFLKGNTDRNIIEGNRNISDQEIGWLDSLHNRGIVRPNFNLTFLTRSDSREPEEAGIWGALLGSLLMLAVTLAISFPTGVAAATYLEEFAPRNRITDLIELNINNLAAVPSVVFGLLGLAVFLNFFGLPRSSPLVGGLVLSLLTLPIIIIAARAAIRSVPSSIKQAALAIGASQQQMILHHLLPAALPGILTGAIIGTARALGETAPLLMIGMVAFIADAPQSVIDPATALPVQIFIWADSPERAFVEKTAAAVLVLLTVLIILNLTAHWVRTRFEKRW